MSFDLYLLLDLGICFEDFSNYFDFAFQGSTSGYSSGGSGPGVSLDHKNIIQKFPFTSDANATDVGDTTGNKAFPGGNSSLTHGYASGGQPYSTDNVIEKFSFATDGNATDVGDLTVGRDAISGSSSTSEGFLAGGAISNSYSNNVNTIDKFPFSSDTNASDVGDLTQARFVIGGQSSLTHGHSTGGYTTSSANTDVIDKYPFTSGGNATDVGNLLAAGRGLAGQQV